MDALDYRIVISEEKHKKLSEAIVAGLPATNRNVVAAAAIKTVLGAAISFGVPTTPYIQ
jgi:hypothetical protein